MIHKSQKNVYKLKVFHQRNVKYVFFYYFCMHNYNYCK